MTKYSPADIDAYIARAEYAANNALWSIERAYLPPQEGAPAAFVLLTCLIDFLGTLYTAKDSSGKTYQAFVATFMKRTYDGVGYDGEELHNNLRNKLVHNYAIWQGKYVLTHGHREKHLKPSGGTATILNLENFFDDVKQVAHDYFAKVKIVPALQEKLSDRISSVGTIKDVVI